MTTKKTGAAKSFWPVERRKVSQQQFLICARNRAAANSSQM
jgi:hypothetical protein